MEKLFEYTCLSKLVQILFIILELFRIRFFCHFQNNEIVFQMTKLRIQIQMHLIIIPFHWLQLYIKNPKIEKSCFTT